MLTCFFWLASPSTLLVLYISVVGEQVLHNPSVGRQVQLSTNQRQQLPREVHLREASLVE